MSAAIEPAPWMDLPKVLDYAGYPTAAAILRAFAELPPSTQALAHAAAQVRARLGEGWTVDTAFGLDKITVYRDDVGYVSFTQWPTGVHWFAVRPEKGGDADSLDDAITAALSALEAT